MLTVPARLLGDAERDVVERLLDEEPFAAAQVAERVEAAGVSWWRQDARIFGYGTRRRIESLCWAGANVVPVRATPPAIEAFAGMLGSEARMCSSLVGTSESVLDLWSRLQPVWGAARDVRPEQPLLMTDTLGPARADPQVRLVRPDEIDLLYPASVAMYTEEVGVSPVAGGDDGSYRERIADLIRSGRAYARIANGRVIFKAELAIVTRHTAQVQGVWTAPELRGHGIATGGMAAVVLDALRRVAPTVSLYVNSYNEPARAMYAKCGFWQVGTFATVLF
jgi:uncharacterized protein